MDALRLVSVSGICENHSASISTNQHKMHIYMIMKQDNLAVLIFSYFCLTLTPPLNLKWCDGIDFKAFEKFWRVFNIYLVISSPLFVNLLLPTWDIKLNIQEEFFIKNTKWGEGGFCQQKQGLKEENES